MRNYENGNQSRNNDNNENNNYDFLNQSKFFQIFLIPFFKSQFPKFTANGREMTRMINTHIEASKIGRQIAEQVLDYQRRLGDASPDSSSSDPDPTLAQTISLVTESHQAATMSMDNSSVSSEMPTRLNGTYSNFSTFNHSRTSSALNLENGMEREF